MKAGGLWRPWWSVGSSALALPATPSRSVAPPLRGGNDDDVITIIKEMTGMRMVMMESMMMMTMVMQMMVMRMMKVKMVMMMLMMLVMEIIMMIMMLHLFLVTLKSFHILKHKLNPDPVRPLVANTGNRVEARNDH